MPRPHRARTVALAFAAGGIAASIAPFVLPAAVAGDNARGILFVAGVMALLFGGGTALFRHRDSRAMDALARGEGILARWRVDPATWRAFVEHVGKLGPLYDEFSPGDSVPDRGVEVIVGENAVQVGDGIVALPRHGTPEVTHAELHAGDEGWRPSYIELGLYYPGGGTGASGIPHSAVRTVLRFPVVPEALGDAQRVVAHYAGSRPGAATFFHGRGDGSDPEDVSACYRCGHQTHKFIRRCPRCGASLQSRRWSRRFGVGLLLCGLSSSRASWGGSFTKPCRCCSGPAPASAGRVSPAPPRRACSSSASWGSCSRWACRPRCRAAGSSRPAGAACASSRGSSASPSS